MEFLITGVLFIGISVTLFLKTKRNKPTATIKFENGSYSFAVRSSRYYSIALWGVGNAIEYGKIVIRLTVNGKTIAVNRNLFSIGFYMEGRRGVEYWGFSTKEKGECIIHLDGLENLKLKNSPFPFDNFLIPPIDVNVVKILIYPSARPLVKITSFALLVLGVILIVFEIGMFVSPFN